MIWIFVDNMLTDVDCLPRETLLVLITLENFLQKTNFIPHLLTKWQEEV